MGRTENSTGLIELGFVVSDEIQRQALSTLFPEGTAGDSVREERGFIGLIRRSTGARRHGLILQKIIPQETNWVAWGAGGLTFSPRYFSRAFDLVAAHPGSGLIIVHSHFYPEAGSNKRPSPSTYDLKAERQQLHSVFQALPEHAPVAAGILSPNGGWRVREYTWLRPRTTWEANSRAFAPIAGKHADVVCCRIVGSGRVIMQRAEERGQLPTPSVESTLLLWGEGGQGVLRDLRVGVVGAGGVGSIIVEFLARLGIGELVLVDFDLLKVENLNRALGALKDDLGKPKVEYLAHLARNAATTEHFRVSTFRGSAAERDGLGVLLDCDIILNASDSPFSRQVLDHASFAHLIPVVDGGTTLLVDPDSGSISGISQVAEAGPGRPCLECQGIYTREEATLARESVTMQRPNPYLNVAGESDVQLPRAPSVISHNGFVASLMVQRLLRIALGLPPTKASGQQRYYLEEGQLLWTLADRCNEGCPKAQWVGLGDSHPTPVGVDPIWNAMRESESRASSATPKSRLAIRHKSRRH